MGDGCFGLRVGATGNVAMQVEVCVYVCVHVYVCVGGCVCVYVYVRGHLCVISLSLCVCACGCVWRGAGGGLTCHDGTLVPLALLWKSPTDSLLVSITRMSLKK